MSAENIPILFPAILVAALFISVAPGEDMPDGRMRPPSFDWKWFVGSVAFLSAVMLLCAAFGGFR